MYQHYNEDVAFERLKDLQREMENSRLAAPSLSDLGYRIWTWANRASRSRGAVGPGPDPVAQVGKGGGRQAAVLHLPLQILQALERDVLVVMLVHAWFLRNQCSLYASYYNRCSLNAGY